MTRPRPTVPARFTTTGRDWTASPRPETNRAGDGSRWAELDRRYGLSRGLAVLGASGWFIAAMLPAFAVGGM